jgi:hypothetical protein
MPPRKCLIFLWLGYSMRRTIKLLKVYPHPIASKRLRDNIEELLELAEKLEVPKFATDIAV